MLLTGAQVIGGAGVPEKINSLTLALAKKATVEDLSRMEYAYTPPLAPSHNGISLAAENAARKIKRLEERKKKYEDDHFPATVKNISSSMFSPPGETVTFRPYLPPYVALTFTLNPSSLLSPGPRETVSLTFCVPVSTKYRP